METNKEPICYYSIAEHERDQDNFMAWIFRNTNNNFEIVLRDCARELLIYLSKRTLTNETIQKSKSVVYLRTLNSKSKPDLIIVNDFSKTVIVIEDKINASIINNLPKYRADIERKYQGYNCFFYLLNINKLLNKQEMDKCKNSGFIFLGKEELLGILEKYKQNYLINDFVNAKQNALLVKNRDSFIRFVESINSLKEFVLSDDKSLSMKKEKYSLIMQIQSLHEKQFYMIIVFSNEKFSKTVKNNISLASNWFSEKYSSCMKKTIYFKKGKSFLDDYTYGDIKKTFESYIEEIEKILSSK